MKTIFRKKSLTAKHVGGGLAEAPGGEGRREARGAYRGVTGPVPARWCRGLVGKGSCA